MNPKNCYRILLTSILLLGIATAVPAQEDYTPVYNPTLHITKMAGEIRVDGKLDDSGWRTAGRAGNFAEHNPGDQTKPPVETEAFITYDDDRLYVAMICYDDPATIRASFCDRDRVHSDDNICFLLDTYGDAAWAYECNVNPYGIQADLLWSSSGGEDGSFDMIWESAGIVTDSGYQVELAIPFSSLRFPNTPEQTWKVDFWRNHPREVRRQYSWAAYDRDIGCWPCQWGTVTGIRNVQPGKGIEILPTFVGYQYGELGGSGTPSEPYSFSNEDPDGEFSLNGKYSIASNVIAEAAYNPDFSQVEADAPQIDVNTNFALSFQERRPFFQEGADLFRTPFTAVYTRSINDPQFAGKLTARLDRRSFAFLAAQDEHTPIILPFEEHSVVLAGKKSFATVVKGKQTFSKDSQVGVLVTDRRLEGGGSGSLLSFDGNIRLSQQFVFDFQTVGTHTTEADDDYLNEQFHWMDTLVADSLVDDPTIPDSEKFDTVRFDNGAHTTKLDGESFWGYAVFLGFRRETANSYADISYIERSPTFRADVGFQPANNMRNIHSYAQYHFRFDNGLFERLTPSLSLANDFNTFGENKNRSIGLSLEGTFRRAQASFHGNYTRETEKYGGVDFDNVYRFHMCLHSTPSNVIACGGHINYGHEIARRYLVMGSQTSAGLWLDIKPMDRLLIENWYNYIKSDELDTGERLFEGYNARTRISLQITKELSLRIVGQYDDFSESWDLDPLLTYRLNPFSIFYVGTTLDYWPCTDYDGSEQEIGCSTRLGRRQFFMKLQYLFQM